MQLLLVQHGRAVSEQVDPRRPLSDEGRREVQRVARVLEAVCASALEQPVMQVRHSGKARAEQTATMLAASLPSPPPVVRAEHLAPGDDPAPLVQELNGRGEESGSLMVVGHLPHLARLAGALLCGQPERCPIRFVNAGIVALRWVGPQAWAVEWSLSPCLCPPVHGG